MGVQNSRDRELVCSIEGPRGAAHCNAMHAFTPTLSAGDHGGGQELPSCHVLSGGCAGSHQLATPRSSARSPATDRGGINPTHRRFRQCQSQDRDSTGRQDSHAHHETQPCSRDPPHTRLHRRKELQGKSSPFIACNFTLT